MLNKYIHWTLLIYQTLIAWTASHLTPSAYYDYQLSKTRALTEFWWQSFGLKITVLPQATFLASNGTNTVACNFVLFAANYVKGRSRN